MKEELENYQKNKCHFKATVFNWILGSFNRNNILHTSTLLTPSHFVIHNFHSQNKHFSSGSSGEFAFCQDLLSVLQASNM